MSLATVKSQLTQLLSEEENQVIALTGKWGTGKTHLWREVRKSSTDERVRKAVYVSLFGLSELAQMKFKLLQSALPAAVANPAKLEKITTFFGNALKVLQSFHKGGLVAQELALLSAPTILSKAFIVIDDIERKHSRLCIDEILGFIDEYTNQHGARIVLILNSDELSDKRLWDQLREKVVDQEIRVSTSPSEALDIAVTLCPSPHAEQLRRPIELCELCNIRVIQKVIRAVNRILAGHIGLSDATLARIIPSTVLLAAIHFRGIQDGPDFDVVLRAGEPIPGEDNGDESDPALARRRKWRDLLQALGIFYSDEYELLVVEFLQSGLFDINAVAQVIERYMTEEEAMQAQKQARDFLEAELWDHRKSEADLLSEADALRPKVKHLDPYTVTRLHEVLSQIPDGTVIGEALVSTWISEMRAIGGHTKALDEEDLFGRKVHPDIRDVMKEGADEEINRTTVFEAVQYVAKEGGWGYRQEAVLRRTSVDDFERVIRDLPIEDLKIFTRQMLRMAAQRGTYDPHFAPAIDHFVEACRRIVRDANSKRLGKLITQLFASKALSSALTSQPSAEPAVAEPAPLDSAAKTVGHQR